MHQPLKPPYPLPGFSDHVDGRVWNWEDFNGGILHFKMTFYFQPPPRSCQTTASSEGRQGADWQPQSKAVGEMPGMCVSTSAVGTPDCCTPPYRACLCGNRWTFSCRKSGGFQEIGIPAGSAGKHFASWGWESICDHWEFLEAVALPCTETLFVQGNLFPSCL